MTAYHWLVAQGLWSSTIAALAYSLVGSLVAWLLGRSALGRVYRELTTLWREHITAQREQARHLAAISQQLKGRS